jgi:hypothetical protein
LCGKVHVDGCMFVLGGQSRDIVSETAVHGRVGHRLQYRGNVVVARCRIAKVLGGRERGRMRRRRALHEGDIVETYQPGLVSRDNTPRKIDRRDRRARCRWCHSCGPVRRCTAASSQLWRRYT